MVAFLGQFVNDNIGKRFPPFALVRSGPVSFDRECGVQQQDALPSPASQVATLGNGDTQIAFDLLEDVLERRRKLNMVVDRETKAMSLIGFVVRVLSQDDHFHAVERTGVESRKNLAAGRIDRFGGVFVPYERGQCFEIGLVEFVLKTLLPTGIDTDIHIL